MKLLLKVGIFVAVALFAIGATKIISDAYESGQREKYTHLAIAEMDYFDISTEKRGGNLEDDIKRLIRARNLYSTAVEYGADPKSPIMLNIDEQLKYRFKIIQERAKEIKRKNPMTSMGKFWNDFSKAVDKINKVQSNNKGSAVNKKLNANFTESATENH